MKLGAIHSFGPLAAGLCVLAWGCDPAATKPGKTDHEPEDPALRRLVGLENEWRAGLDLERWPAWERAAGSDPFALANIDADHYVGIVRGVDKVVLLDAQGKELHRVEAPALPSGLRSAGGDVYVVGEGSPDFAVYRVDGDPPRLHPIERRTVDGAFALRDIAVGRGRVYLADRHRSKILVVDRAVPQDGRVRPEQALECAGATALALAGRWLVANCILEQALLVYPIDGDGDVLAQDVVRIQHDGPFWGIDIEVVGEDLWVAAVGVEDHALDRTRGWFGYVDSFVYFERIRPGGSSEELLEVNLAEHGVVTPKWVDMEVAGGHVTLETSGYGSANRARVTFAIDEPQRATVASTPFVPGVRSALRRGAGWIGADPLLDAWVVWGADGVPHPVRLPDPDRRSWSVRVGEAILFTELIGERGRADQSHSRFTCETCHFEGTTDGRVHHTGRGDVHASTRTLLGVFNNRPHFSRAYDRTTAQMIENEFRVAAKGTDGSPWFAVEAEGTWLEILGAPARIEAAELRESALAFLKTFNHAPNPRARGRTAFSDVEARGSALFRRHCESCHQARRVADDPDSRVGPESWQQYVFAENPALVWGQSTRMQTGITPYVHPAGPRVPSLRRVWQKRPLFTQGSAEAIEDVLDQARVGDQGEFAHGVAGPRPGLRPLDAGEREALAAFVQLL